MIIDAVYDDAYQASGLFHFERFHWVYQAALTSGLIRAHRPVPFELNRLQGLHEPDYLLAMASGVGPLARSSYLPWSAGLLQTCLSMLGGQLRAAQLALAEGLAFNLACGFHHAHPERGGGYCVFNGLALIAAEHPTLEVLVLDCDEHGGDGTEAFCRRLPNLTAISIFGTRFGLRGGSRSIALSVPIPDDAEPRDRVFLEALDQALDLILQLQPDLVLYQASADSHVDDPKATLRLSSQTLATRDLRTFQALDRAGIPVLVSLAGGYQSPATVGALYLQSIQMAARRRPLGRSQGWREA